MKNDYLTTVEVARMHECQPVTVRLACSRGELRAIRIGDRWMILRKDAEAWTKRDPGRPKNGEKR